MYSHYFSTEQCYPFAVSVQLRVMSPTENQYVYSIHTIRHVLLLYSYIICSIVLMMMSGTCNVCMYVCGHTYSKSMWINQVRLPILHVVS